MTCAFKEDVHDEHRKLGDLKIAILITMTYFAIEFAAGYFTNSLAAIGDSIHMLTDGVVLVLTFWAYKFRSAPPRNSVIGYLSFGFRRLELLVMILNTFLVGTAIFWILKESYLRLRFGNFEVFAWPVFLVGILGFIVNMTVFRILNVHSHEEEGIKSAIACALTDALSPVAVIIGSVAILINPHLFWFDTLAALAIAGMLAWSFRNMPRVIFNMMMEAAPLGVDFEKIRDSMKEIPGVDEVSDLHINKIGSGLTVLTGSVLIENHGLHDSVPVLIENKLKKEFPELKNAHFTIKTVCN